MAPEDLVGTFCYQLFQGRDTFCIGCPTEKALASGKIEHAVMHHTSSESTEGETYWDAYAVPIKNQAGDIGNLIQMSRNITDLKLAERKIKDYAENLETMVEERTKELNRALYDTEQARDKIDGILKSVGDGLIVTDLYNRVILMNRAAEDLLGARLSEVINEILAIKAQIDATDDIRPDVSYVAKGKDHTKGSLV